MILTQKSIEKNIKKVLPEEESTEAFVFGSGSVHKKLLWVMTSFGKHYFLNTPVFGTPKIKSEFTANDVEQIDFVGETKSLSTVNYVFMKIKGVEERIKLIYHPVNTDFSLNKIIAAIYAENPASVPEQYKDLKFIDFISTSEGVFKFYDKKIIQQVYKKGQIETVREIDYQQITDVDLLPGTEKQKLYLEIDNQPITAKFRKQTENIGALGIAFGAQSFHLKHLSEILRKTTIAKPVPHYLDDDENGYGIEKVTLDKTFGLDFVGNKYLRVTDKAVYILKKEKTDKLEVIKRLPLNEISQYKRLKIKKGDDYQYGIEFRLVSGETVSVYQVEMVQYFMNIIHELKNKA